MLSPAFPFGGMEHPGVTMFNEESFIYREPPTLNQRLGRRATIYHEVAHHWFGDYVTMKWFDDLWLKEGFATYMAAKMQDIEARSDPARAREPSPWMSFYLRNKPAAYDVDQTSGTTPVWQQLANLDQAKSNYGAIVYNKAPSILKQLNYLVGDAPSAPAFTISSCRTRTATRRGKTSSRDRNGGASVRSRVGKQYILRPGMPVLEQHVDVADGKIRRLVLIQHPAQQLSGPGVWPMRTEVVLWSRGKLTQSIPVEIRAETTVVTAAAGTPAPDFVFANANDNAYGLVMLDDRERGRGSAAHVGDVPDTFLRAMLWGALWDLVRDARLAPARVHRHGAAGASRRAGRTDRRGHRHAPEPRDVELSVRRRSRRTSSAASRRCCSPAHRTRRRSYGPSQEPARRVHLARALGRGNGATRRMARQQLDGGPSAPPADALVDHHASDRARHAQCRRAGRRRDAPTTPPRTASAARSSPAAGHRRQP